MGSARLLQRSRLARLALRCAGLALLLATSPAQAALEWQLADKSLTAEEAAASRTLLEHTSNILPPQLVQQLGRPIQVEWITTLPTEVIGRATPGGQLQLNRRFLSALIAGDNAVLPAGRTHGTLQRELVATLVHEIAHFYDRGMYLPNDYQQLLRRCQVRHDTLSAIGLPSECRGQVSRRYTLSDDPRLLDLAGWPERVGERGQRELENRQLTRTPDDYELTSPREFVAVNLEYFLTDPQYRCRRPALHAYFARHFSWAPRFPSNCAGELPFINAGLDASSPALGWLDPERIYQVHYLLAEPNDAWASRWGHSMLRLVMCAPGRPRGPDCLLDLEHHLVLSFRAFVNDVQLSSWDGLIGNYPSRLFLLPFNQVVDEYTKQELRSLSSIPLRLDRAQQLGLARRAAEMHWSYDGTYYFISNNCAVETLKLLRSGSDHRALRDLDSMTPIGLLRSLEARGLADTSVLQNRSEALRKGLFFDSYRERYQRMYSVVRERLQVPPREVEGWLDWPARDRQRWFAKSDHRTAAALLLLEQAALHRLALAIRHELKKRYLSTDRLADHDLSETADLMRQAMLESSFLSRPAQLLPDGYGLPQPEEWQALEDSSGKRQRALLDRLQSLDQGVQRLLTPDQVTELESTRTNISQLGDLLRQLHRDAGGLELP
ncbi:DUF4105 domain-containing protein [Pseudomonas sp. gcc21]|uniref:DUF7844 domain-containing protein n=1 Tax=Pseudomonas sp. gcc21 TaxID=2726989 RepID=UPI0014520358|nr:DUF4105 domain-containing protein [Pseudomonas sp. gcc21]QJD58017.1 DUF4105 domain-containing protein [Pseudomonas sp. gcc21]